LLAIKCPLRVLVKSTEIQVLGFVPGEKIFLVLDFGLGLNFFQKIL
jgi:hypothetical protein